MKSHQRLAKWLTIFVLSVFLLSSFLMLFLYLDSNPKTDINDTNEASVSASTGDKTANDSTSNESNTNPENTGNTNVTE